MSVTIQPVVSDLRVGYIQPDLQFWAQLRKDGTPGLKGLPGQGCGKRWLCQLWLPREGPGVSDCPSRGAAGIKVTNESPLRLWVHKGAGQGWFWPGRRLQRVEGVLPSPGGELYEEEVLLSWLLLLAQGRATWWWPPFSGPHEAPAPKCALLVQSESPTFRRLLAIKSILLLLCLTGHTGAMGRPRGGRGCLWVGGSHGHTTEETEVQGPACDGSRSGGGDSAVGVSRRKEDKRTSQNKRLLLEMWAVACPTLPSFPETRRQNTVWNNG